jgi:hypothetical protein
MHLCANQADRFGMESGKHSERRGKGCHRRDRQTDHIQFISPEVHTTSENDFKRTRVLTIPPSEW